jgi:hypothetical protein
VKDDDITQFLKNNHSHAMCNVPTKEDIDDAKEDGHESWESMTLKVVQELAVFKTAVKLQFYAIFTNLIIFMTQFRKEGYRIDLYNELLASYMKTLALITKKYLTHVSSKILEAYGLSKVVDVKTLCAFAVDTWDHMSATNGTNMDVDHWFDTVGLGDNHIVSDLRDELITWFNFGQQSPFYNKGDRNLDNGKLSDLTKNPSAYVDTVLGRHNFALRNNNDIQVHVLTVYWSTTQNVISWLGHVKESVKMKAADFGLKVASNSNVKDIKHMAVFGVKTLSIAASDVASSTGVMASFLKDGIMAAHQSALDNGLYGEAKDKFLSAASQGWEALVDAHTFAANHGLYQKVSHGLLIGAKALGKAGLYIGYYATRFAANPQAAFERGSEVLEDEIEGAKKLVHHATNKLEKKRQELAFKPRQATNKTHKNPGFFKGLSTSMFGKENNSSATSQNRIPAAPTRNTPKTATKPNTATAPTAPKTATVAGPHLTMHQKILDYRSNPESINMKHAINICMVLKHGYGLEINCARNELLKKVKEALMNNKLDPNKLQTNYHLVTQRAIS